MDKIIGGVFGVAMGVIVIAAIYQLNKKGSPIVPAAEKVTQTGLASIFK
jgi:hypothetical protein